MLYHYGSTLPRYQTKVNPPLQLFFIGTQKAKIKEKRPGQGLMGEKSDRAGEGRVRAGEDAAGDRTRAAALAEPGDAQLQVPLLVPLRDETEQQVIPAVQTDPLALDGDDLPALP